MKIRRRWIRQDTNDGYRSISAVGVEHTPQYHQAMKERSEDMLRALRNIEARKRRR